MLTRHIQKPNRSIPNKSRQKAYKVKNYLLNKLAQTIKNKKQQIPNQIDFLFFITEPTHFNQLVPVAKHIHLQGRYIFLTPKRKLYNKLIAKNLRCILFDIEGLFPSQEGKKNYKFFQSLWEEELDPEKDKWLITFFETQFFNIHRAYQLIQKFIAQHQPRYLFLGNDFDPVSRAVGIAAKHRKIPVGMIQHGLIGKDPINKYHLADQFFVYGGAFEEVLISDGYPKNKIIISGAPYLDLLKPNNTVQIHPDIVRKFDLKGPQYILIAISGPGHRTSHDHYQKILETLVQWLIHNPRIQYVIKLHRKEKKEDYLNMAASLGLKSINLASIEDSDLPGSIFEWFNGCQVLITGTSTVAIEAMLRDIPVISLDVMQEYRGIGFIEERACDYVNSLEELQLAVDNFLNPANQNIIQGRKEFLRKRFYKLDRKASARIINYANHSISTSNPA